MTTEEKTDVYQAIGKAIIADLRKILLFIVTLLLGQLIFSTWVLVTDHFEQVALVKKVDVLYTAFYEDTKPKTDRLWWERKSTPNTAQP